MMTDIRADYITWILRWAADTGSLIIWHERDGGLQPVLFPNDPFGWFDDTTPLYETTEGDGSHRGLPN